MMCLIGMILMTALITLSTNFLLDVINKRMDELERKLDEKEKE